MIRNSLLSLMMLVLALANVSYAQSHGHISGPDDVCQTDVNGPQVAYASSVTGNNYTWKAGGGSIGSQGVSTVYVNWTRPGNDTLTVVVQDDNDHIISRDTLIVHVRPNPAVHISASKVIYCQIPQFNPPSLVFQPIDPNFGCTAIEVGDTVQYQVPAEAGAQFAWTVDADATIISGAGTNRVTVVWGNYNANISVLVTHANGCQSSDQQCFYITAKLRARFTTNTNVCGGVTSYFTNTSVGADSYSWKFGDGVTSHDENPTHIYAGPGTYNVTLVAMQGDCRKDTFNLNVVVSGTKGPEIICPATVCSGETKEYSTKAAGCSYLWTVTGGTINSGQGTNLIYVTWDEGNMAPGSVSLQVSNCSPTAYCSMPSTISVPIIPAHPIINGPSVLCTATGAVYSLPGNPLPATLYTWDVTGGVIRVDNQNYNTTASGNKLTSITVDWNGGPATVKVTLKNDFVKCSGTTTKQVNVKDVFRIVDPVVIVCNGTATTTYHANGAANWTINGGNSVSSNGTVSWTAGPGTYRLKATAQDPTAFCTTMDSADIQVLGPAPKLDSLSGEKNVCANTTYFYTVYPALPDGYTTNWTLKNGILINGTRNSAQVIWTAGESVYEIKGSVASPYGCHVTADTVKLTAHPKAPITPVIIGNSNACLNDTSMYAVQSMYGDAQYIWSVSPTSNGYIVSDQGTDHIKVIWNAPGTGTVSVSYKQCNVTPLSASKTITVNPAPAPQILAGNLCKNSTAVLSTSFSAASYTWYNNAGGVISTGPTATVSDSGFYSLVVTNASGCHGNAHVYVPLNPSPKAKIATADKQAYCTGMPINVSIDALAATGYMYQWYKGSSLIFTNVNPITVHTAGDYTAVVSNQYGCSVTSNHIVITSDTCIADTSHGGGTGGGATCTTSQTVSFTYTNTACNSVALTNTSSAGANNFTWDFGDGSSLSQPTKVNPTNHTYTEAGYYSITLSGKGDTCTLSDQKKVRIPVIADFTFTPGCIGSPTCFSDQSTHLVSTTITSWNWNFGDGHTGSGTAPCNSYVNAGTYTVTLTVSNDTCSAMIIKTVIIAKPHAAFAVTPIACVNSDVAFMDQSTSAVGIASWFWDFKDGSTSTLQNPTHQYASGNNYRPVLKVTNNNGCADTISHPIHVATEAPGVITANGNTSICHGDSLVLTAPNGTDYLWSTGATTKSITVHSTGYYANNGDVTAYSDQAYTVSYTGSTGCMLKTDPLHVTTKNVTPPEIFGSHSLCAGTGECLTITGSYFYENYGVQWYQNGNPVADGCISGSTPIGTVYTYTVKITDHTAYGCSVMSEPFIVKVQPATAVPAINGSQSHVNVGLCKDGDAILTTNATPGTFVWSTGATTQSITVQKSGEYTVSVMNASTGCDNSNSATVVLDPLVDMSLYPKGCYTRCTPDTLVFPAGDYDYYWTFNGTATGSLNSNIVATQSGNYRVVVKSRYAANCTDTSGVIGLTLVKCDSLNCAANARFTANAVCAGNASTFTSIADAPGRTHLWSFGDGTQSNGNPVSHVYAAAGIYKVKHTVKSFKCNDVVDSMNVTVSAGFSLTVSHTDAGCSGGGTATAIPTGGSGTYTYQWSTAPAQTAATATGLSTGAYAVSVTDAAGCKKTASVTISSSGTVSTQDFVGNNGFEEGNIPVFRGDIDAATGWFRGTGDPDLFDQRFVCRIPCLPYPLDGDNIDVPANHFGYQDNHTPGGGRYAGIYSEGVLSIGNVGALLHSFTGLTFSKKLALVEAVETKLSAPMDIHKTYIVSFYVSRAEKGELPKVGQFGLDPAPAARFVVKLSTGKTVSGLTQALLYQPVTAPVKYQGSTSNSTGWDLVTFTIKPDAAYQYLVIESLEPTYTDTDLRAKLSAGVSLLDLITGKFTDIKTQSYIYVDDVSCKETCNNFKDGDFAESTPVIDAGSFSIYPNPNDGRYTARYFVPALLNNEVATISVFDLFGREIRKLILNNVQQGDNTISMDLNTLENGLNGGIYLVSYKYGDIHYTNRISVVK